MRLVCHIQVSENDCFLLLFLSGCLSSSLCQIQIHQIHSLNLREQKPRSREAKPFAQVCTAKGSIMNRFPEPQSSAFPFTTNYCCLRKIIAFSYSQIPALTSHNPMKLDGNDHVLNSEDHSRALFRIILHYPYAVAVHPSH